MIAFKALALACVSLALTSCSTRDVSDDQKCWGDFKRDGEYTAYARIYLVERDSGSYDGLVAIPDSKIKLPARRFMPPVEKHDPTIKGVITPGQKLRAVRITLTRGWNFFVGSFEIINIFGMVEHDEVLISELSTKIPEDSNPCGQVLAPNPNLIR